MGVGGYTTPQQRRHSGQDSATNTVHVQARHQFPKGLRPLARGHAEQQKRGGKETGFVLPTLYLQPTEDNQVA